MKTSGAIGNRSRDQKVAGSIPDRTAGLHVRDSLFLSDFNETWIFSTKFGKILKQNLIEILPVGAE
jgi:hypothetical protein